MPEPIIVVEHLSKLYQLGVIGTRTLQDSLQRQWYRIRGKEHLLHNIGVKHQMIGPDHPQAGPRPNTMWALKDVSFEVKQGEVLGIIGRNGAGKSTILKILTRITEPTSGRALVYGRVASLLEVGTGFHPELTGRENVYLSGAVLGMKKAEIARKFDEIVAFSEVEQYIDTPVKRYSSGMYVRLAFAVAAHLDPEILIVDEVLAVGDAEFQKKCLGRMGDVAGQGRTVLFVSHNMASIRQLCSIGLRIDKGRVTHFGRIDEVVSAYSLVGDSGDSLRDVDGRDEVVVNDLRFLSGGVEVGSVFSGEDLEIRLTLTSKANNTKALDIGIMLETFSGVFVMRNYSNFENAHFRNRTGTYCARIRKLPFASGKYKFHIRITSEGREIYRNPYAGMLEVFSGDFFGTGAKGEERHCLWLQRVDWGAEN